MKDFDMVEIEGELIHEILEEPHQQKKIVIVCLRSPRSTPGAPETNYRNFFLLIQNGYNPYPLYFSTFTFPLFFLHLSFTFSLLTNSYSFIYFLLFSHTS